MGAITQAVYFLMISVKVFVDAQVTCSSGTFMSESVNGNCPPNAVPGTQCTFQCRPGYIGVNNVQSFTLSCGSDGRWQGVIPSCSKIVCPLVSPPSNGRMEGKCDGTAIPGDTCNFFCNPGYQMSGSNILTCRADGTWRRNPPSCLISTCPDILPSPSVQTSGSCVRASPGSVCSFSCPPGYQLSGPGSISCGQDLIWTGGSPSCIQLARCPDLPVPTGGYYTGRCTSAVAGDSCTFTCDDGSTPSSSPLLICEQDGTWSSQAPTCSVGRGCANLFPPANGQTSGICAGARPRDVCAYTCFPGYQLIGARQSKCLLDGSWTTSVPTCSTSWPENLRYHNLQRGRKLGHKKQEKFQNGKKNRRGGGRKNGKNKGENVQRR